MQQTSQFLHYLNAFIEISDVCACAINIFLLSLLEINNKDMKALAILRVSTITQQIDDQRDELFEFIRAQGYDEIIPIEAVGASAIKMDEKYMELVEKVKATIIADKEIKAACVWELSRLGRNEIILMEFKEFFISHNIQFICKNPYMKLLEENGSVNTGMELAFSLFATMSKQEMTEKKERFARAKKSIAAKGLFLGGNTLPFGYKIEGKNTFVENPEESKVVRLIFELYSTGEYSAYSLGQELQERGYSVNERQVVRIIGKIAYTGERIGKLGVHYPPIITRELFDKCAEVRGKNKIDMKRGERVVLARGLIKCCLCGGTCTASSHRYICARSMHHGPCTNNIQIKQAVADDLLWRTAYGLHMEYLVNLTDEKVEEHKENLKIIEEKIVSAKKKLDGFQSKKERIIESYVEGLIDKKSRDLRLKKLEDEVSTHLDNLNSLESRKMAIMDIIDGSKKDTIERFESALAKMKSETMFDVIHKHIKRFVATREVFGKSDPRSKKENALRIVIDDVYGNTHQFMYIPRKYLDSNLYIWNGKEWVKDYVTGLY